MSIDGPFLCDAMCGKLAVYLRMCGYDTAYALDRGVEADDAVLDLSRAEGRTLLTRDRDLAARAEGVLLTEREIEGQLRELHDRGMRLELAEPTRCGACNGRLQRVDPAASTPDYAPDSRDEAVWRCCDCGQCFWKGSHWKRVEKTLP
ncbi:Mut7-C RNAse domain-containing protein [Halorarius halobius]|uniref:Mut7-C RNAse domain-containing protein n=1 Tax=Halorarius halobius TaxID=2962671 RepID=UPI0020CC730A|nr:Mut7-C RNAse domain-containing protein [Halorarius halobius]